MPPKRGCHRCLKYTRSDDLGNHHLVVKCRIKKLTYVYNHKSFLFFLDLTAALTKKEEKLKKKEKLLEEYSSSNDSQKQEISELQSLKKRLEQALAKKEKQYTKVQEKLSTFEQIQAQIFSLSKTVQRDDGDDE